MLLYCTVYFAWHLSVLLSFINYVDPFEFWQNFTNFAVKFIPNLIYSMTFKFALLRKLLKFTNKPLLVDAFRHILLNFQVGILYSAELVRGGL